MRWRTSLGRLTALDASFRAPLKESVGSIFPPYSEARADWPTMFKISKSLGKVFETKTAVDLARVSKLVGDLAASPAWIALESSRGEDFHRWRPQSAGLTGAARGGFGTTNDEGVKLYEFFGGQEIGRALSAKYAHELRATGETALRAVCDCMTAMGMAIRPPLDRLAGLRVSDTD